MFSLYLPSATNFPPSRTATRVSPVPFPPPLTLSSRQRVPFSHSLRTPPPQRPSPFFLSARRPLGRFFHPPHPPLFFSFRPPSGVTRELVGVWCFFFFPPPPPPPQPETLPLPRERGCVFFDSGNRWRALWQCPLSLTDLSPSCKPSPFC